MRKTVAVFIAVLLAGCSKEEIARNAVINAMTGGYWKVVRFKSGTADATTDFSAYKFQFKENFTVDALSNSVVVKTGTWSADPNAKTITSSFANAGHPLALLNGTWHVTRNDWNYVEASQNASGEPKELRLEKN